MCIPLRFPRWLAPAAFLCGCLLAVAAAASERKSSFATAVESISADELKRHVDYLASDALKGRESGRPGGQAAGKYVRDGFAAIGLSGAGSGGSFFQDFGVRYRNVLAMLEGNDPKLKNQIIVVGAHYDHVGYGTRRNSRGPIGRIHNGADDNASGTAGLLELAEAFTMLPAPPKRSILFFAFDAEERGMLGSKYWISHPTVPLDRLVAMLNMDMIGRLRDDRLIIFGTRSGGGWRRLISEQNEGPDLRISFRWTLKANSDHFPFFRQNIPILLWYTGVHNEYHSPRDDAHLINNPGISRVVRLLFGVTYELANRDEIPRFRKEAGRETEYHHKQLVTEKARLKGRLGVGWNPDESAAEGIRVTRITPGSAADRADLELGDRIVEFNGRKTRSGDDLRAAVLLAENPAGMVLKRHGKEKPFETAVKLDGKPVRLGIHWRPDPAEPGTIVLTRVISSSPAARAGLRTGDRIYQVGGKNFSDGQEFSRLARTLPEPLELLVERDGQLRIVVLYIETEPLPKAA